MLILVSSGKSGEVIRSFCIRSGCFACPAGAELIIGQMVSRKADGSYALMVCAADDPQDTANKTFDVTFRCDDFKVKAVGAPLTKLADGSYSISMKSCGGALIVAE